jgi:hypothetical protein
MYAFYVVRGHKLDDLVKSNYYEKVFLHCAREEFYKEEIQKYKSLFGEK